jgi:hypothetical protein
MLASPTIGGAMLHYELLFSHSFSLDDPLQVGELRGKLARDHRDRQ